MKERIGVRERERSIHWENKVEKWEYRGKMKGREREGMKLLTNKNM